MIEFAHYTKFWLSVPLYKRVTVNLAPADLRKEGSGLDLPIAIGILAATDSAFVLPLIRMFSPANYL